VLVTIIVELRSEGFYMSWAVRNTDWESFSKNSLYNKASFLVSGIKPAICGAVGN
jgi:hypothetical protein